VRGKTRNSGFSLNGCGITCAILMFRLDFKLKLDETQVREIKKKLSDLWFYKI
jgi:hypothetical protein